jgi:exodeoxyribonuclease X
VHHLSDEELRTAPKLRGALTDVMLRAGFDPSKSGGGLIAYAAHNAEFDRGFVGQYLSKDVPWLCTWRLSLHLYPDVETHSNQALRYALPGLDANLRANLPADSLPHRALYDAITTAYLLQRMLAQHSLEQLLQLQDKPVLQRVCRFGKHRGSPWADIQKDYLKWILRADPPFDRDVQHTARYHLGQAA